MNNKLVSIHPQDDIHLFGTQHEIENTHFSTMTLFKGGLEGIDEDEIQHSIILSSN